MPKFAANLHYLFNEVPFLDRFGLAAEVGFKGVEFQVPIIGLRTSWLRSSSATG